MNNPRTNKVFENGMNLGTFDGEYYFSQNNIFKNYNNFQNNVDSMCYITEFSFNCSSEQYKLHKNNVKEGYTFKDFFNIAKEYLNIETVDKHNHNKIKEVATQIFLNVDYQCPETIIEEWDYLH